MFFSEQSSETDDYFFDTSQFILLLPNAAARNGKRSATDGDDIKWMDDFASE